MATTEEHYTKILDTYHALKQELEQPRCVNCENNHSGYCLIFRQSIPQEHKYEYTDCKQWQPAVPF